MIKSKLMWDRVRVWSAIVSARTKNERVPTERKYRDEREIGLKGVTDEPDGYAWPNDVMPDGSAVGHIQALMIELRV